MKPLIYGYMRVQPETPDDDLAQVELALKQVAEREGYCFATIFQEFQNGCHAAFYELMNELQRAEAHHVIVPSLEHLSGNDILCNHLLMALELKANAQVLTLGGD
ncbi:recombinase family protein [Frankia sp. Cj3]|uniref:recombinase family protein n=1 Tax=Frankia sp. Cj3 TaxID=2880976 RepID=UPI00351D75E5